MSHDEQVENLRQAIDRELKLIGNIHQKCSRRRHYPQYDIEELLRHTRRIDEILKKYAQERGIMR